jgi:tight adherence protein C
LEAGARKEIAMMLPVVFLVLPVTVVFTLLRRQDSPSTRGWHHPNADPTSAVRRQIGA